MDQTPLHGNVKIKDANIQEVTYENTKPILGSSFPNNKNNHFQEVTYENTKPIIGSPLLPPKPKNNNKIIQRDKCEKTNPILNNESRFIIKQSTNDDVYPSPLTLDDSSFSDDEEYEPIENIQVESILRPKHSSSCTKGHSTVKNPDVIKIGEDKTIKIYSCLFNTAKPQNINKENIKKITKKRRSKIIGLVLLTLCYAGLLAGGIYLYFLNHSPVYLKKNGLQIIFISSCFYFPIMFYLIYSYCKTRK